MENSRRIPEMLDAEAERFAKLLKTAKALYNEKRFGVTGNHIWLIMMEEFVAAWTQRELGTPKHLKPSEIAALIVAGKVALNWNLDKSPTDPILVTKAIRNFRRNPQNAKICGPEMKASIMLRCNSLAKGAHVLGIEI